VAREYRLKNPFAEPETYTPSADRESSAPTRQVLTVSELTRQVQTIFEETFAYGVWVEGELSDPKVYPSGHLWFSLKDPHSTLKSVMWRDDVQGLKFEPEQGLQVICYGKVDFYPARGEVKFVVRSIEPKGMGALQLAFEQLQRKLEKEGLFKEERKRPLPIFPERIGIVTSPRGAAIDDMLELLRGKVETVLYPSRVQGDAAAGAIAHGIQVLNQQDRLDLLIIGRGGGSLEDLWAFNEEQVARAVAASGLPVISAVGHEKDISIADLVADIRATTPTKAAEIVLAQRAGCLDRLRTVLEEPAFTEPEQWLEELQEKVEQIEAHLLSCSPRAMILQQAERLHRLQLTLETRIVHRLDQLTAQVHGLAGQLHALSPLAVLERGYSITFDEQGKVLKQAGSVKVGDSIETKLHQGRIRSKVERVEENG